MPRRALSRRHAAAPLLLAVGVAIVPPLTDGGARRARAAAGPVVPAAGPSPWRRVATFARAHASTRPLLAFAPDGARVLAWGADPATIRVAGAPATSGGGPFLAATRGDSYLLLAAAAHTLLELPARGAGDGGAGVPHRTVLDRGRGPLALADYMTGETAVAAASARYGVTLRVRRPRHARWSRAVALARPRRPVTHLAVALDWRGDALVAFSEGAVVYVRERHVSGRLGPLQRLGAGRGAGPVGALGVLVSDDGRGIVAWRSRARTLLEVSQPRVRFAAARPAVLDSDPTPPGGALRLVRLATGRVLVAWTGVGPAVRIDPVSVAGPLPGLNLPGRLCDLVAGPAGDAEALWADGGRLYAARGTDVGTGLVELASGEPVGAAGAPCADAAVAVRPTDDVPAVAWRDAGGGIAVAARQSTASSTPSSSPTRQTSSRSSSTSTHAPAENGKTT